MEKASNFIIREVQRDFYPKEIQNLRKADRVPRGSGVAPLSPFLDDDGVLRVGGRLNQSELKLSNRNPVILPGKSHVATLLVRHYHALVHHQGRHLTEGAIRSGGFWITGGKRLIASVIHACVKCRVLRGRFETQKMADLPPDRLESSPPFTFVGVDVFGPWMVTSRRTRGGHAQAKRWAVLFICATTRAVHIEVVEEMSSSSFVNALCHSIRSEDQSKSSDPTEEQIS